MLLKKLSIRRVVAGGESLEFAKGLSELLEVVGDAVEPLLAGVEVSNQQPCLVFG